MFSFITSSVWVTNVSLILRPVLDIWETAGQSSRRGAAKQPHCRWDKFKRLQALCHNRGCTFVVNTDKAGHAMALDASVLIGFYRPFSVW